MGWTFSVVRMPYGAMWRRHRRAFHEHFHVNAVQKYIPIQTKEILVFLHRLLVTPENFIHHIRQCDIYSYFITQLIIFPALSQPLL